MADIKTKKKNGFKKYEIVSEILRLKKQPLTDKNKLKIQHLQQKLDTI